MIVCLRKLCSLCGFCCNFFFDKFHLFFFLFQFFHSVINRPPGIVWWCPHRIAGTSVALFPLYPFHALSLLLKALLSPLYFARVCMCVRKIFNLYSKSITRKRSLICDAKRNQSTTRPPCNCYFTVAALSVEELHAQSFIL